MFSPLTHTCAQNKKMQDSPLVDLMAQLSRNPGFPQAQDEWNLQQLTAVHGSIRTEHRLDTEKKLDAAIMHEWPLPLSLEEEEDSDPERDEEEPPLAWLAPSAVQR